MFLVCMGTRMVKQSRAYSGIPAWLGNWLHISGNKIQSKTLVSMAKAITYRVIKRATHAWPTPAQSRNPGDITYLITGRCSLNAYGILPT